MHLKGSARYGGCTSPCEPLRARGGLGHHAATGAASPRPAIGEEGEYPSRLLPPTCVCVYEACMWCEIVVRNTSLRVSLIVSLCEVLTVRESLTVNAALLYSRFCIFRVMHIWFSTRVWVIVIVLLVCIQIHIVLSCVLCGRLARYLESCDDGDKRERETESRCTQTFLGREPLATSSSMSAFSCIFAIPLFYTLTMFCEHIPSSSSSLSLSLSLLMCAEQGDSPS